MILYPCRYTREVQEADLRGAIRELEWKLERLPHKHPAYAEATRPELEERLTERRKRLAKLTA